MEAADTLYGVSMGDDGVSKVVSRRLPREACGAESADARLVLTRRTVRRCRGPDRAASLATLPEARGPRRRTAAAVGAAVVPGAWVRRLRPGARSLAPARVVADAARWSMHGARVRRSVGRARGAIARRACAPAPSPVVGASDRIQRARSSTPARDRADDRCCAEPARGLARHRRRPDLPHAARRTRPARPGACASLAPRRRSARVRARGTVDLDHFNALRRRGHHAGGCSRAATRAG